MFTKPDSLQATKGAFMATFYVKVVNTMQSYHIYEGSHVINNAKYFLFVTRQM